MSMYGLYGLGDRDEVKEMSERYWAMVNTLSQLFNCGRWDIEEMFDSENNIEVGDIVTHWVEELGYLPDWNTIYREALLWFASDNNLEEGKDVDIYTNCCLDTHIYARKDIDEDIKEKLETLFGTDVEELA